MDDFTDSIFEIMTSQTGINLDLRIRKTGWPQSILIVLSCSLIAACFSIACFAFLTGGNVNSSELWMTQIVCSLYVFLSKRLLLV